MLIDAENAYDLSQTRTNEAEACGVVLHVDESCAHAAQARLMEVGICRFHGYWYN